MTASPTTRGQPLAVLGAAPTFADGLPLARPCIPDIQGVTERIAGVLASGQLTNGQYVRLLERRIEELCGVRHAVAVSSCTVGLMLVYRGLDVDGPVVLPSMTFAASAHAVVWAGGQPRWADIEEGTLNTDPTSAAEHVGGARAISATHVYGTPCDVEGLTELAAAARLPLVFDAAHALGARRCGRPVGGFGTAEVFSLSPTKVVPAGEGGIVTTNDDRLAGAVRLGRDYGNPGDYDCEFVGINGRMSELHAVVALASLEVLPERIARRQELVHRFAARTGDIDGLRCVIADPQDSSTYKDLTVVIDTDEFGLTVPEIRTALAAEGVDTRRYFHPACHQQRAYAHMPSPVLPVTEALSPAVMSLPLHPQTTESEIDTVADLLGLVQARSHDVRRVLGRDGSQPDRVPRPRAELVADG